MGLYPVRDLGAHVKTVIANASQLSAAPILIVAGGAGDNIKVTGEGIDRLNFLSGVLSVSGLVSLGDGDTFSLAIEVQESDDNSSFDVAEVLQASAVVATGGGGGTDEFFVQEIDENLAGRKQFVRYNITPDFSAGATDTGHYTAVMTLGGSDEVPAV